MVDPIDRSIEWCDFEPELNTSLLEMEICQFFADPNDVGPAKYNETLSSSERSSRLSRLVGVLGVGAFVLGGIYAGVEVSSQLSASWVSLRYYFPC